MNAVVAEGRNAVSEFDYAHGAGTGDICEVGSLDIVFSENARHAKRYQPSPHHWGTEIIRGLALGHAHFSFLDFGAGKGRIIDDRMRTVF
jgi:hypothetical protein